MCGIVGLYQFAEIDSPLTTADLVRMRDAMAHRGPDGVGLWQSADEKVLLGHRRLSIIDLSTAANQPMSNEDGTLWLVFNGEIYNHSEIRAELVQAGHYEWQTDHSDTEVILHAFQEWGIDCLQRFRGMFAFGLWDAQSKALWLVRDRIGIKPLYYSLHNGRVTFASEIKALLEDPAQPRRVNQEALYHYLSFLTPPAPDTLFEGIRKLPAGSWLRIDRDGQVAECRYYDVWDNTVPLIGESDDALAERILNELRQSVGYRKVSDVPVGVFLSGGIDSSTNTALFAENETRPVRTFSIGYVGEYKSYRNELDYARLMASTVGAEHYERLLTLDDLIDFLPQMVRLQDEPIADPVCVPLYYVSRLARTNGVTVCQVGEGADELFWGYEHWKTLLTLQRFDNLPVPSFAKTAGVKALTAMGHGNASYTEWLRRGSARVPIFWGGAEAFTEAHKRQLLAPRLRRELNGLTSWDVLAPIHQRFVEKAWEPSPLHWMTTLDLNLRLPELLLMRVDKMAMGVGLEGRVPFLDHKFVELVLSISQSRKTKGGTLKYLLKRAVEGLIPREIINRPKQGFGVPVYEWFFGRLGEMARNELDLFCRDTDFFDREAVLALLDQGRGPQAWYLLNFALWWRAYFA